MIFSPAQAAKLLCPQRSNEGKPLACLSNACAWWRYADQTSEYGFCGAAGEPPVYRLQSGDYPIRLTDFDRKKAAESEERIAVASENLVELARVAKAG